MRTSEISEIWLEWTGISIRNISGPVNDSV